MRRTCPASWLTLVVLVSALTALAWTPVPLQHGASRDLVYPKVQASIVFSHASHEARGTPCITCHAQAKSSTRVVDRLVPVGQTCDACHGPMHTAVRSPALADVATGPATRAECTKCHGAATPAPTPWPQARLTAFSHKKHGDMGMACAGCHGDLSHVDLATERNMPSMAQCQTCHSAGSKSALAAPSQSACTSCHERDGSGRMRTQFPEGQLRPEHIGVGLAHTADFARMHASSARSDGATCNTCHSPESCTDCHAGRTKPHGVHAGDVLRTHGVDAKLAAQNCASCHRTESFCAPCHAATGVASGAPSATRATGRQHPSKNVFINGRGPESHAMQATQNLATCTSCHAPQDCTSCHGSQGIGGGVNPHGSGFASRCGVLKRANSASCIQCHLASDPKLSQCQ